jgi:hypothetical protein
LPKPASGSCSSNSYQSSFFPRRPFGDVIKKKVRDVVSQRTTDEEIPSKGSKHAWDPCAHRSSRSNPSLREDITHE